MQKYPVLSRDGGKRLLILPEPKKSKEGLWSFEEMLFRDDEAGRSVLWRLFLATVDHISLHAALSNYTRCSELARHKDVNLATFSVSLVEDALIEAYAARTWPDVFGTQVYANTVAFLRLKKPTYILNEAMKAQTALLMKLTVGRIEGEIPGDMAKSVEQITYRLKELKSNLSREPRALKDGEAASQVDRMKLDVLEDIYAELEKYGSPPEVAALPHQDHHGECHIFTDLVKRVSEEEFETLFEQVYRNLGGKEDHKPFTVSASSMTANDAFSKWEVQNRLRKKILNKYSDMVRDGHFRSIGFPPEDYGKYLHIRSMLGGPIRRMIEYVRMIKNDMDENFRVEAGIIDLQEAIQVIASEAQRSDVFVREDPLRKNESWSLLIDTSSSVSGVMGEARSYATCLAEVAAVALAEVTAGLSGDNEPWGMYGFSDSFHIIKDFDESYSNIIKARIGGIKPRGLTYLPDAVKIVANIIKASSMSERNFMVVVSDGLPAGYDGIEDDLTEALDKAEKKGILALGVGLDTKHIKRFFKHYCIISSLADLLKSYIRAYMELSSVS